MRESLQVARVLGKKQCCHESMEAESGQLTSAGRLISSVAFGKLDNSSVLCCNHWQKDGAVGRVVEG